MFKALQAKFTQHKDLKELLLSTKNRELVEHSPYDSYWGDGGDGSGKNKLGILLMKLRKDLTPTPRVCTPPTPVADPPILPTSVHSHLQRDAPADTEPSSSPKQHKQRDWAIPPRVSPERSSNQQSDNLAGQPVFHQLQQNSAVSDHNRAQLGPSPVVPTVSTSPVTQQHGSVNFSYSSIVAGRNQQGVSMSNPQQPFQSGDQQSTVISASQPHPQSQQSNTFSQTSAQPTLPYTRLNNISETASATQQAATATNASDRMSEFNVSNLTRNHLPGYQTTAAGGSHASMPVHVQSAPNPNSSSQAKDPLPMDTSK